MTTGTAPATIEARPLSFHIGAEIDGVDLTRPLSARTVTEIRAAFLKWTVVFFRGQSLDHDQHLAFARRFGEPTVGHAVFGNVDGHPEIYSIAKHRKSNRHEGAPMVRPWTGERALYVSPVFLKSVVGLHPRESLQLLELPWEHAVRPDYTVRFRWQPGDIAFWDNRSTRHLAPSDIFQSDAGRQLYRVTLVGDVPVGVDGTRSTAIEGEPVLAYAAA